MHALEKALWIIQYVMMTEPPPRHALAGVAQYVPQDGCIYVSPRGFFGAEVSRANGDVQLRWKHRDASLRHACMMLVAFLFLSALVIAIGGFTLNWWFVIWGVGNVLFIVLMSRIVCFFVRPDIRKVQAWIRSLPAQ